MNGIRIWHLPPADRTNNHLLVHRTICRWFDRGGGSVARVAQPRRSQSSRSCGHRRARIRTKVASDSEMGVVLVKTDKVLYYHHIHSVHTIDDTEVFSDSTENLSEWTSSASGTQWIQFKKECREFLLFAKPNIPKKYRVWMKGKIFVLKQYKTLWVCLFYIHNETESELTNKNEITPRFLFLLYIMVNHYLCLVCWIIILSCERNGWVDPKLHSQIFQFLGFPYYYCLHQPTPPTKVTMCSLVSLPIG